MEPPVPRPRGRPRKRRRKEDKNGLRSGPEIKKQAIETRSIALVGRYVLKEFRGSGVFLGKVVYYDCGLYRINYEDGDSEDLDSSEIRGMLLDDSYLDDDLTQRRIELDDLVLKISVNVRGGFGKSSDGPNKDGCGVEPSVSSGGGLSSENGEEQVEGDADSSSGSCLGSKERDFGSDAETPPIPPLQLPPSSGTIGIPEPYVSHLFSVYGFLRSFSTRLFLGPFSLDEFVGSLNCRVSNTLFDAIHVSLMRALSRHLEFLSSEGSEVASKCLRCNDWGLLDILTWPVLLIQYLAINGNTKGDEWKEFCDDIYNGEYYLLSASRKLIILQSLCDDVLESQELKAEMNMREESETGMDYDEEDILPADKVSRRVHQPYAQISACKHKEAMSLASKSTAEKLFGNSISYFRDAERTEDADVDGNGDECRLCGMDGILLCCDGCPSVYHSRCIGLMKISIPEGLWYCPECKINMSGPKIEKGTSLRGAEIFGKDLHGQLFLGACDHLLVLNVSGGYCIRYYNQNDIPKVLQALYASIQHRPIYHGICLAVLQCWNIPESVLPLSHTSETYVNSEDSNEDAKFSSSLLPSSGVEGLEAVNLVKPDHSVTTIAPSLDASLLTTERETLAPESSSNCRARECPPMNMKLPVETRMESIVSVGSVIHQSDINCQNSVDRPSAVDPANCTLVNSRYSYFGHVNDLGLPINLSSQIKEVNQSGSGKSEGNSANNFVYMGCTFKPQSYINYYMHGDFAASAAAKLAILSSEDFRSESHVSDSQKKVISANNYLQAKAFSLTASRFFWPSSEKKLVEVPRERCGWCLSCKAPVSSKKGCMLNHAALSATKSAMKILAGLRSVRPGEGILPRIVTYIVYMEESLRGLIVGPFLSANYRKQWRLCVENVTTFNALKPLLLELEQNIRTVAFSGDWVKLMDDWLAESCMIQSAACSVGTTQKRAPSGRRCKKQSAIVEVRADGCHENNFAWWHGGKLTKFIFQKAVLPKSMVRKAGRQGGLRKISGIFYADGSEIPKRNRQFVWRASVQMSRNASQLALQVRYLDFHLRWSDLIRPEQNLQDGKGQESEASAFRNAIICDKKLVDGKICYGIAFGSQKHLPSRVMKNVIAVEQGLEGMENYWFLEAYVPLYLVKEYEKAKHFVPSDKEHINLTSQLHRRQSKFSSKDIFFYLTCKRDKLDILSCSVCQLAVSVRNAFKCSTCQGYYHDHCSISSDSTNNDVEFMTTCKRCYCSKLLTQKETSNKSPISPFLLQEQEPRSVTVLKRQRAPCYDQTLTSTRTEDICPVMKQGASESTLATKSRRSSCSWGIIWKKKGSENTGIDFRLRNILLKGSSGVPQLEPVCYLCRKPYSSDLMYICCETCKNWYHAEAVELQESKFLDVLSFKCCKCRRIKSPVCPYSDMKYRMHEGNKTHRRASQKKHLGVASDSGTLSILKEREPATPFSPFEDAFSKDSGTQLFPRSSVQLIIEPKLQVNGELNAVSGQGPKKLPVRRHIKQDGDGCDSFESKLTDPEFITHNGTSILSKPAEKASSPSVEYDSAVQLDRNLLNDCESAKNDHIEFEPHTYFSVTEFLPQDDSLFQGANASGILPEFLENSHALEGVPECRTGSLVNKSKLGNSLQGSAYNCRQCSLKEPAPDLSCEICGLWFHSQCSLSVELPSSLGNWRGVSEFNIDKAVLAAITMGKLNAYAFDVGLDCLFCALFKLFLCEAISYMLSGSPEATVIRSWVLSAGSVSIRI
ncbi:DDT domain-containing protein PTM-like [Senna tora]|uniref:DDT domain-containing protein PTM-like n=1 Tax=Senna tora TaxID=362788 RepID=A0A834TJD8_9FABA|nr:DDT domain-containing protein PTM-like [Senna tora]